MLFKVACVVLMAWLLAVLGPYKIGELVHVLLLAGLMLMLLGVLKARDAQASAAKLISDLASKRHRHVRHRFGATGPMRLSERTRSTIVNGGSRNRARQLLRRRLLHGDHAAARPCHQPSLLLKARHTPTLNAATALCAPGAAIASVARLAGSRKRWRREHAGRADQNSPPALLAVDAPADSHSDTGLTAALCPSPPALHRCLSPAQAFIAVPPICREGRGAYNPGVETVQWTETSSS